MNTGTWTVEIACTICLKDILKFTSSLTKLHCDFCDKPFCPDCMVWHDKQYHTAIDIK